MITEEIYLAGGCLWGVEHFMKSIDGVLETEAGRANGSSNILSGPYDGYSECVKITFDTDRLTVTDLIKYLFEIIDPYSIDKQGNDVGHKYRTGIYSLNPRHLQEASEYLASREDSDRLALEILPLTNYIPSAPEHQDHLERFPEDYYLCHIPLSVMNKYRKPQNS